MKPIILPISFRHSVKLFAIFGFACGLAIGWICNSPWTGSLILGLLMAALGAWAHYIDTKNYWRIR